MCLLLLYATGLRGGRLAAVCPDSSSPNRCSTCCVRSCLLCSVLFCAVLASCMCSLCARLLNLLPTFARCGSRMFAGSDLLMSQTQLLLLLPRVLACCRSMREVTTMTRLPEHQHVLKLLGVCTQQPNLALVTQ